MFYNLVKSARFAFLMITTLLLLNDCTLSKTAKTPRKQKGDYVYTDQVFIGKSSWYGKRFNGRKTANGERFNMFALTAAHKTLPFGTLLRVKNLNNDKAVIVKVNDRGPFIRGRVLDLSYGAAEKLGFAAAGVTTVEARVVIEAKPAKKTEPTATKEKPIKVSQNRDAKSGGIN